MKKIRLQKSFQNGESDNSPNSIISELEQGIEKYRKEIKTVTELDKNLAVQINRAWPLETRDKMEMHIVNNYSLFLGGDRDDMLDERGEYSLEKYVSALKEEIAKKEEVIVEIQGFNIEESPESIPSKKAIADVTQIILSFPQFFRPVWVDL